MADPQPCKYRSPNGLCLSAATLHIVDLGQINSLNQLLVLYRGEGEDA
jgi:hypothetical protein